MAAKNDSNKRQSEQKAQPVGKRTWLIQVVVMLIVAVVGAGAGFGLANLFAQSHSQKQTSPEKPPEDKPEKKSVESGKNPWYYELPPVIANLNVPEATRYVRATITLEMSPELKQEKGKALLDAKQPILINWLTIYLSSLTLEDVTGDKNLRRIQAQICDAFNEKLFPDSKPKIRKTLLKEFPIQ